MEEFIWMAIILKIPLVALLWLVWYAIKEPAPAGEESTGGGGGGAARPDGPHRPRPPRRGDHAPPGNPAPARVRARAARTDTVPRA